MKNSTFTLFLMALVAMFAGFTLVGCEMAILDDDSNDSNDDEQFGDDDDSDDDDDDDDNGDDDTADDDDDDSDHESDSSANCDGDIIEVVGTELSACRADMFWHVNGSLSSLDVAVTGYGFMEEGEGWTYDSDLVTVYTDGYDTFDFDRVATGAYRFTFISDESDWADLGCPVSSSFCNANTAEQEGGYSLCIIKYSSHLEVASQSTCDALGD